MHIIVMYVVVAPAEAPECKAPAPVPEDKAPVEAPEPKRKTPGRKWAGRALSAVRTIVVLVSIGLQLASHLS